MSFKESSSASSSSINRVMSSPTPPNNQFEQLRLLKAKMKSLPVPMKYPCSPPQDSSEKERISMVFQQNMEPSFQDNSELLQKDHKLLIDKYVPTVDDMPVGNRKQNRTPKKPDILRSKSSANIPLAQVSKDSSSKEQERPRSQKDIRTKNLANKKNRKTVKKKGHEVSTEVSQAAERPTIISPSTSVRAESHSSTEPNSLSDPTYTQSMMSWHCEQCNKDCVIIREECRCLCGHRYKEHTSGNKCTIAKCKCKSFFYIVAEGAWIIRCRCKHKHTDHDPSGSHQCTKFNCKCSGFHSPFVCNCNHPWHNHIQTRRETKRIPISQLMIPDMDVGNPSHIMRGSLTDSKSVNLQ